MPKTLPSLFQSSKVDPEKNDKYVVQQVHTVNFYSTGVLSIEAQNYFDSRLRFLQAAYEFAKKLKIEENEDFVDNALTQLKMEEYLKQTRSAAMIRGTEFGVITTKVRESIASISKNKYLKDLQEAIIRHIFELQNPEMASLIKSDNPKSKTQEQKKADNKLYNETLKGFQVGLSDLLNLNEAALLDLYKYKIRDQVQIWRQIAQKIGENENLASISTRLEEIDKIAEAFLVEFGVVFGKSIEDSQSFLKQGGFKNSKHLVESFVNRFFFQFDAKSRVVEDNYLPDLNEKINDFMQHIKEELQEIIGSNAKAEDLSALEKEIKDLVWDMGRLDYMDSETPDRFLQLLEWALAEAWEKVKDKRPKKTEGKVADKGWFSKDNIFLRRPKDAPSYPSIKDKMISWNKDQRTSLILSEVDTTLDSVKLMDFWLNRCMKVVQASNVYKVYRHLTRNFDVVPEMAIKHDFEWMDWLIKIIANQPLGEVNYAPERLNIESRKVKQKDDTKDLITIRFMYDEQTENRRLEPLTFTSKIKGNQTGVRKERTAQEYLQWWLEKEFEGLGKDHIELGMLRKYYSKLDQVWIKEWLELLKNTEERDNLARNRDKRLTNLRTKSKPKTKAEDLQEIFKIELEKLENHLLLNQDHDQNFAVFDKVGFKRYQNLSQTVFESVFSDLRIVREYKARLAKLLLDSEVVLPIKIDRMTFNKPNGKSTLAYEVETMDLQDTKSWKVKSKSSHILIYPVNLGLSEGKEYKIVDSLAEAQKQLGTGKFERLFVGFLNGSGDNFAQKQIIQIKDKDGNPVKIVENGVERTKQYQVYGTWRLKNEISETEVADTLRGQGESVGATNPAGYPQMYFFLVPKICNNLIIPVESNIYYLSKYSPYHHLNKYFDLAKELTSIANKHGLKSVEYKTKMGDILKLRAKLRYYYRLSSLEVDLERDLRLVAKEREIIPVITAKAHMQFGNPVGFAGENDETGRLVQKKDFTWEELPSRFETILSIDLGEKHIACATLSKVNWSDYRTQMRAQSFLPLQEKPYKTGEKSDLEKFLELQSIPAQKDNTFNHFRTILSRYETEQKKYGVVNPRLKKAKKDFTDQVVEKISTQIAKIALKHKSFVVFENLPKNAFGSKKHQLSLYTEVYRKTAWKLQKVGLIPSFDIIDYVSSDFKKGFAVVNPGMTSKKCSNMGCGYIPRYNEENGIQIVDNWIETGNLEFKFKGLVLQVKDGNGGLQIYDRKQNEITKRVVEMECFRFNKSSAVRKNVYATLKKYLYTITTTGKRKKIGNDVLRFILDELLNPRKSQERYSCPACGFGENEYVNADYQASYNIGCKFLEYLKDRKQENNNNNKDLEQKTEINTQTQFNRV